MESTLLFLAIKPYPGNIYHVVIRPLGGIISILIFINENFIRKCNIFFTLWVLSCCLESTHLWIIFASEFRSQSGFWFLFWTLKKLWSRPQLDPRKTLRFKIMNLFSKNGRFWPKCDHFRPAMSIIVHVLQLSCRLFSNKMQSQKKKQW